MLCLKLITLKNGMDAIAVAEFNEGYSHIIDDDRCWIVTNGGDENAEYTPHLFKEAIQHLKLLPDHPYDHKPLVNVDHTTLQNERDVRRIMES